MTTSIPQKFASMMRFFDDERPRLAASMSNAEQSAELYRRWMQVSEDREAMPEALFLEEPLPEHVVAELNLVYQGMTTHPPLRFIYVSAEEPAAEAPPAAAPLGKRCREADVWKFFSKIKKDTLQSICDDLELPVTGNKDALARSIVKHTATM